MSDVGDYSVIRELAADNGDGVSYLATAPNRLGLAGRTVVLRMFNGYADDSTFDEVASELRQIHAIDSPYVVPLLDAGAVGGRLFFTTPHFPAGNLSGAQRRPTVRETLTYLRDAARGTHALHEHGIVHRNIKPGSVAISSGRGLIGNPNLAHLVNGDSTTVGGKLRDIEFVAPDSIWGKRASRSSDIWSLGMTTYRSLTGRSALGTIPSSNLLDACRHVLHTVPTTTGAGSADIEMLLGKCFSKQPELRYATAAELAEDLHAIVSAES